VSDENAAIGDAGAFECVGYLRGRPLSLECGLRDTEEQVISIGGGTSEIQKDDHCERELLKD